MDIKQGEILNNEELCDIFKCSPQGGMRRSHSTNTLIIVSNNIKSIYADRWEGEILHYTGMGSSGNQSLSFGQNKTLNESKTNTYFITVSIILFFLSFFYPSIFKYPNKIWFRIGIILGLLISPLIMFLIYYIVFLPIGFTMRLINKDFLKINIDKNMLSYWTDKQKKVSTMKNQF